MFAVADDDDGGKERKEKNRERERKERKKIEKKISYQGSGLIENGVLLFIIIRGDIFFSLHRDVFLKAFKNGT